jgi:hypothetical protein
MKQQKTFGLSVLTHRMAHVLMPGAKKVSHLQTIEKQMVTKEVDPVVAKNVLEWHKKKNN